jgi:predicted RNA-binding protein associated with RNAse of E/G family
MAAADALAGLERVTVVVLREVWFDHVWRAGPMRLVEERDGLAVLFRPPGTVWKLPFDESGRLMRIPATPWTLVDHAARDASLAFIRPGARHSVWLTFDHTGEFDYWYINFERDTVRTRLGFDTKDEKLDLVVRRDGSMRWKDEDELAEAARRGLLDEDEVRSEAERVIANPPWPTGWEDWQPDPSWEPPGFPPGWDEP